MPSSARNHRIAKEARTLLRPALWAASTRAPACGRIVCLAGLIVASMGATTANADAIPTGLGAVFYTFPSDGSTGVPLNARIFFDGELQQIEAGGPLTEATIQAISGDGFEADATEPVDLLAASGDDAATMLSDLLSLGVDIQGLVAATEYRVEFTTDSSSTAVTFSTLSADDGEQVDTLAPEHTGEITAEVTWQAPDRLRTVLHFPAADVLGRNRPRTRP